MPTADFTAAIHALTTVEELDAEILTNVDRYYADEIDHPTFSARQGVLHRRIEALGLGDAWSARALDRLRAAR